MSKLPNMKLFLFKKFYISRHVVKHFLEHYDEEEVIH